MEYHSHQLSNNLRLIFYPTKSEVGYCGMFINTGSRDELENEHGLAHFIEHVIFKGTKKRNLYQILSRIDDVGGEINAYTTKEETCIYSTFLKSDLERAIELVSDITINSQFPADELKKEVEVVIDEINSYKDSPAELIFDDFEDFIFKNHPMGRNILGIPKEIRKFKHQHIENFIKRNYNTDQMVFCVLGNYNPQKVVKLFEKYFDHIPQNNRIWSRNPISEYIPTNQTLNKKTFQSHCLIGNRAYNCYDERRLPLHLLNNLLGGSASNSRLNWSLREKSGIAYTVESNYSPYFDTGIFNIYFGTDKSNIEQSLEIIHKELAKLRNEELSTKELHRIKRQTIGQMAISFENRESLLFSVGKSYLLYGKVDTLEDVYNRIEKISAAQLQDIANEVFNESSLSYLIYK